MFSYGMASINQYSWVLFLAHPPRLTRVGMLKHARTRDATGEVVAVFYLPKVSVTGTRLLNERLRYPALANVAGRPYLGF